jgi:hypothetical protein
VTERPNEVTALVRFGRSQWPIVLVAVLVGALVGGAWAYMSAPDPGFVAKQRLRVAVGITGVPNIPTVDSVIAAVALPDVRESAAASLGIAPAKLGAVSAAVDGKNTSVVVISAQRTQKAEADRVVRAVSAAVRERVLGQIDPNLDYQRLTLEQQKRRIALIGPRLAELNRQLKAGSLTVADRAGLESAVTNLQDAFFTAQDRADLAELQLTQAQRYVYLDGTAIVAPGSSGGYLFSSVLRGALIGLLAGLAIGWLRFRSRRRGATS